MDAPAVPGALLLALDLQPSLLGAVSNREHLLRRCRLALTAANGLGLPAAFTEQVPTKLGPTEPALLAAVPDAPVLAKTSFSAFGAPPLSKLLRAHDVEHLLLCGVETSICVYQTAIDALNENLQVTILSDAVGGRRQEDGAHALAALARAGVHVLPTETVLYSLIRDAQHPYFKALTQLVKSHD